uniref:Uncharacterized protein n=1 Tax=Triticum urartu TaxID=4572 RepID=A0A8R7PK01_TRIUA
MTTERIYPHIFRITPHCMIQSFALAWLETFTILYASLPRNNGTVMISGMSGANIGFSVSKIRGRGAAERPEEEAGAVVDVGDLGDGEVAEAEAGNTDGAERVPDLHGVLQHGDADGGVQRGPAEAAAEADAQGLGADGAHGAALARLPAMRGVALALARRHGWRGGGRLSCCWV